MKTVERLLRQFGLLVDEEVDGSDGRVLCDRNDGIRRSETRLLRRLVFQKARRAASVRRRLQHVQQQVERRHRPPALHLTALPTLGVLVVADGRFGTRRRRNQFFGVLLQVVVGRHLLLLPLRRLDLLAGRPSDGSCADESREPGQTRQTRKGGPPQFVEGRRLRGETRVGLEGQFRDLFAVGLFSSWKRQRTTSRPTLVFGAQIRVNRLESAQRA